MRVVELSNHPGDMLGDAARRRQSAEQRVLSEYEDELIRYRARVQTVRLDRGQRAAIVALIRRDHEFHGKRRRPGARPPR